MDIDPQALTAYGLSPSDVSNAISAQNLVLPSGDAKIGTRDYNVSINSSPDAVEQFNDIPIKQVNGAVITIKDVAHVRDGYGIQQNIVNQNGKRAVLIQINKSGKASTLDVVNRIREAPPRIKSTLPDALKIQLIADQSVFVKASVQGVIREAVIAACLTALMILLFLGSPALYTDRSGLHSAIHSRLNRRPELPGAVSQHDDIGRAGPGRRHPRG